MFASQKSIQTGNEDIGGLTNTESDDNKNMGK